MKPEYGGYIELDTYTGKEFHSKALPLNCGENCLAYLIRKYNVKKLYLPYFCCGSVSEPCRKNGVLVEYYHVGFDFRPRFKRDLQASEWFYLVNFYGQISNEEITDYKRKYQNLIVDNVQAFFQMPVQNVDTLYSCRKFFGVADGAYLYTAANEMELEEDCSYGRMNFLLGRFEKGANEFYNEYVENNERLSDEPVKKMSKLTHNLLRAIDYERVEDLRTRNFAQLHEQFSALNSLNLRIADGAFMYPLYIENGIEIRKILQQKKIYVPTLWPDVLALCGEQTLEYNMAANILPLPVDQRYDVDDMIYIASEVKKCLDCGN